MELDENSQIINLVQSRPLLYTKCNDFRERDHVWKEIADILKLDATWIKSRWHVLRAKFLSEYSAELKGRRSNFKYFNELTFLISHTNIEVFDMYGKSSDLEQAEFVISHKDLEESSDDDSSNIFVELEIENNSSKDIVQTFDLTSEMNDDEIEETLHCIPNGGFAQSNQPAAQPKYKQNSQPKVETFHILEVNEKNNARNVQKDEVRNREKPPEEHKPSSEKEKKCESPDHHPPTESSSKSSEESEPSQLASPVVENERCEDTIFGELVTATLRKMQSEKKRAVKREIMNILFT